MKNVLKSQHNGEQENSLGAQLLLDGLGSERANKLLKNLEISDNIHSKFARQALENPNGTRSTRSHHDIIDVTGPEILARKHADEYVRERDHKQNNGSTQLQAPVTELPATVEEANRLNDKVQFIFNDDERAGQANFPLLKIRYNPLKFLNFKRLLRASSELPEQSLSSHYHHDFNVYEPEDLAYMLDNDSAVPFRYAIANKSDYSTSKTSPTLEDRQLFERLLIESSTAAYYNSNQLLANHDKSDTSEDKTLSRGRPKRKSIFFQSKKAPTKSGTKATSIESIFIRNHEVETWYTTPYPEEYNRNKILYICEFCLKYMSSRYVFYRHQLKCRSFRPPGNEIYRDGKLSVWEIDGRENVIYCQNLCLLAKLFLNSKTLYYDVEPFIFYVLTEREDIPHKSPQFHLVGYFSKEKLNSTDYNLSCILTLPIYQRRGYGQFLMDFSYLLSRREFKWGTPEKPLSDMGLLSYRNYWGVKCAQVLMGLKNISKCDEEEYLQISLEDISNLTGMIPTDVVLGLEQLRVLQQNDNEDGPQYVIKIDSWHQIEREANSWQSRGYQVLNPQKLIWKPMIFGPSCGVNAVGTMVETTGATRTTTGSGNPSDDFFKRSISMLTNFLQDDIPDSRPIEVGAWQKIADRDPVFLPKIQQEKYYFKDPYESVRSPRDQTEHMIVPRERSISTQKLNTGSIEPVPDINAGNSGLEESSRMEVDDVENNH